MSHQASDIVPIQEGDEENEESCQQQALPIPSRVSNASTLSGASTRRPPTTMTAFRPTAMRRQSSFPPSRAPIVIPMLYGNSHRGNDRLDDSASTLDVSLSNSSWRDNSFSNVLEVPMEPEPPIEDSRRPRTRTATASPAAAGPPIESLSAARPKRRARRRSSFPPIGLSMPGFERGESTASTATTSTSSRTGAAVDMPGLTRMKTVEFEKEVDIAAHIGDLDRMSWLKYRVDANKEPENPTMERGESRLFQPNAIHRPVDQSVNLMDFVERGSVHTYKGGLDDSAQQHSWFTSIWVPKNQRARPRTAQARDGSRYSGLAKLSGMLMILFIVGAIAIVSLPLIPGVQNVLEGGGSSKNADKDWWQDDMYYKDYSPSYDQPSFQAFSGGHKVSMTDHGSSHKASMPAHQDKSLSLEATFPEHDKSPDDFHPVESSPANSDERRQSLKKIIVQHGISREQDFYENTPQQQALDWLALSHAEEESVLVGDTHREHLLQRYALAVFFFSVKGENSEEIAAQFKNSRTQVKAAKSWEEIQQLQVKSGNQEDKTVHLPSHRGILLEAFFGGEDENLQNNWVHDGNWMSQNFVCSWYGVECSNADDVISSDMVIGLNLSRNRLEGTPPLRELHMALRNSLKLLDLSHNGLTGNFQELFSGSMAWPQLKRVFLNHNSFSGGISFAGSPLLEVVDVAENHFSGDFVLLESMDGIKVLNASDNSFTGYIQQSNSTINSLELLDISRNHLSGQIPKRLFTASSLVELRLGRNSLNGTISDLVKNLVNLKVLSVPYNSISGEIPNVFASLPNLVELVLAGNLLKGEIPQSLGTLVNLKTLDISHNPAIIGAMPYEVCDKLKAGFLNWNSNLKYVASDCLEKVACSCCDKCS